MMKSIAKTMLASSIGWRISSLARRSDAVTVLMYHRIKEQGSRFEGTDQAAFRGQMDWLRTHCRPVWPEELLEKGHEKGSRIPAVLVTFDDGYRDFHDNAYPILQELRIPSLVFLATSFIGSDRMIWTDEVTWAVDNARNAEVELPWGGGRHRVDDPISRKRLLGLCKEALKDMPDEERTRHQIELRERLGAEEGDRGRQMLNWDEVRSVTEWTRIGGHTHTHPILSRVSSLRADDEIRICTEKIQEETGVRPRFFAYPNGRARDFSSETAEILQKHGYHMAFSTIEGLHFHGEDCFSVRRQPTAARSRGDFAALVAGL